VHGRVLVVGGPGESGEADIPADPACRVG